MRWVVVLQELMNVAMQAAERLAGFRPEIVGAFKRVQNCTSSLPLFPPFHANISFKIIISCYSQLGRILVTRISTGFSRTSLGSLQQLRYLFANSHLSIYMMNLSWIEVGSKGVVKGILTITAQYARLQGLPSFCYKGGLLSTRYLTMALACH